MADTCSTRPPPKLSRYRSTRQAQRESDQLVAQPYLVHGESSCSLSRAPSRYHRSATMPSIKQGPTLGLSMANEPHSLTHDKSLLNSLEDDSSSKYSDRGSAISEFHSGYWKKSNQESGRLLDPPIFEDNNVEAAASEEISKHVGAAPLVKQETLPPSEDIRKLVVECGDTQMEFEVAPKITPVEIIARASQRTGDRILPKSTILLESFHSVGVERPVRLYESIERIMSSWDADSQNSFVLLDPGTGNVEPELTLSGAPTRRPLEMSWILHYSQKPGKWDKRAVTLHPDGRISIRKDIHKPQNAASICHLGDFDIYRPSQEKSRTKIKPPKKFCFAVKSQQKLAVFESPLDFVHFFCTDDRQTAHSFHAAVQAWRSWYLVHVLGADRAEPISQKVAKGPNKDTSMLASRSDKPHPKANSMEFAKSSNQLDINISPERRGGAILKTRGQCAGKMKPALLKDDEPLANISRKLSTSEHAAQPLLKENIVPPQASASGIETALNRYQSQRNQQQSRTVTNSNTLQNQLSTRGQERSTPLIDLTPQYQPRPQHAAKGRAFVPKAGGDGGLIASATSPEHTLGPAQSMVRRFGSKSVAGIGDTKTSGLLGKLRHFG